MHIIFVTLFCVSSTLFCSDKTLNRYALPAICSATNEQLVTLCTEFLTLTRTKKVQTIHAQIALQIIPALGTSEFVDITNQALFCALPADIRMRILTDNFFHDRNDTAEKFEKIPYIWALYLLAEYEQKQTSFLRAPPSIRFFLSPKQIYAVDRLCSNILLVNEGKLIPVPNNEQCNEAAAMLTAQLLGYPKYPHHAYGYLQDTAPLRTISPTIFSKINLSNVRVGCMDDSSATNTHMVLDACKKSLRCYGIMGPKWMIDICFFAYNLCHRNNPLGTISSFLLDGAILYTRAKGYGNNYSYIAQRIALEALTLSIMYMAAPEGTVSAFCTTSSIVPYLLITLPLAYYVRKHERYPNTLILGQPQKQNRCTLL